MKKHYSIQFKLASSTILIAVLVLGTMTFLMAKNGHETAKKGATEKTIAMARAYANEMRISVEHGLDIARNVAHVLESYKKNNHTERDFVNMALYEILEKNKTLIGKVAKLHSLL